MKYKIPPKEDNTAILYVRGVDKGHIESMKSEAKRLGYTLGEYLNLLFKQAFKKVG